MEGLGLVKLSAGEAHLAEVTVDQGEQEKIMDFRPILPLVFHW